MRMWLCDPKFLCRKHLLGEHVEIHMFIGSLKKGINIDGYIKKNLFEPTMLDQRHTELLTEMKSRGMKHTSDITWNDLQEAIKNIPDKYKNHKIDRKEALVDLLIRCPECRKKVCIERNLDIPPF